MGCSNSKPQTPGASATATFPEPVKAVKGMDYFLNCVCVMVVRAGNLVNKDIVATSDPYAVVRVGRQEYSTRVIHNELNPVFNERFSFLVPATPVALPVSVQFYDHNRSQSSEKFGHVRYTVTDKDFAVTTQSHWLPLQGAQSGQAKIRVFASTYICFSVSTDGKDSSVIFAHCAPNSLPHPNAVITCVSPTGEELSVLFPVSKAFQYRNKKNKSLTAELCPPESLTKLEHLHSGKRTMSRSGSVATSNLIAPIRTVSLEDVPAGVGAAPSTTPMNVGTVRISEEVYTQALSTRKVTFSVNFLSSAAVVDEFRTQLDELSTNGSISAGAGGLPGDLSTLRTRSIGSNLGTGAPATPRSVASNFRSGQAGVSIGLTALKLGKPNSIAGGAAHILQSMTEAMDHLLEFGPHPSSPFLPTKLRHLPSSTRPRSRSTDGPSTATAAAPSVSTLSSAMFPKWQYPPLAITASSSDSLREMVERPGNKYCSNCGDLDPCWAVIAYGLLTCQRCAAVYRAIDVGSSILCIHTDASLFTAAHFTAMAKGNTEMNARYESAVSAAKAIAPGSAFADRQAFVFTKHEMSPSTLLEVPTSEPGTLYVIVSRARDLDNKEPVGYSDPHCVVSLGDVVRKTRTIESTLSPKWNENLLGFPWNGSDFLLVQVFDRDVIVPNEGVGSCWISLAGIPLSSPQTIAVPLQGMLSGTVTLELTFHRGCL